MNQRTVRALVIAAIVALAAPSVSLAADAPGVTSLWPFVINFILFIALLASRARPPLKDHLAERKRLAIEELKAATAELDAAKAELAEYEERLGKAQAEVDQMLEDATRVAATERERIVANATATADRIRREATFTVEQEIKRARRELESEVATQAAQQATQAVRDAMTDDDQGRLVDEFVAKEVAS